MKMPDHRCKIRGRGDKSKLTTKYIAQPASSCPVVVEQLMRAMNWTYVSMVSEASPYGDGAASDLKNLLLANPAYEICLAAFGRIPSSPATSDYDAIVDKLVAEPKARVVILYMAVTNQVKFFKSVRQRAGVGRFLFLGGDVFSGLQTAEYTDLLEGSIYADAPNPALPGFVQYVWSLTYGQVRRRLRDLIAHANKLLV